MNTATKLLFLTLLFLPISFLGAEEVATEEINAQLLPTVWFSKLKPAEGESVKVHTAVQNNSGTDFSGTVTFFVNDAPHEKVQTNFASGALTEVSAPWNAKAGKYKFHATLEPELPDGQTLLAYETEKVEMNIHKPLTIEDVKEKAGETFGTIALKIDEGVEVLSARLETYKRSGPDGMSIAQAIGQSSGEGIVAGTALEASAVSSGTSFVDTVVNKSIDGANFLLENWRWTLPIIALLVVILSFII